MKRKRILLIVILLCVVALLSIFTYIKISDQNKKDLEEYRKTYVYAGNYLFREGGETGNELPLMQYEFYIDSNTGRWHAQLEMINHDGKDVVMKVMPDERNQLNPPKDKSMDIVFDSYLQNGTGAFNKGDMLFKLIPTQKGLLIKWNVLKPVDSKYLNNALFEFIGNDVSKG